MPSARSDDAVGSEAADGGDSGYGRRDARVPAGGRGPAPAPDFAAPATALESPTQSATGHTWRNVT